VLRSRDELHRYLRPPASQPREVLVRVCAAGGRWERDHLLFRDYLRAHPAAGRRYAGAKQAAARRRTDDGWAYTDAKTGVILDILEQAEDWQAATGRAPHWAPAGARSGCSWGGRGSLGLPLLSGAGALTIIVLTLAHDRPWHWAELGTHQTAISGLASLPSRSCHSASGSRTYPNGNDAARVAKRHLA
jgi:hypothetical protein